MTICPPPPAVPTTLDREIWGPAMLADGGTGAAEDGGRDLEEERGRAFADQPGAGPPTLQQPKPSPKSWGLK